MDFGLTDKYAMVTGGSHGIGRSTALALAREGCNVAICARNQGKLDLTVSEIREYGVEAVGICTDVLKPEDIKRAVSSLIDSWHTIHILINNIGGGGRWGNPVVEETEESVWQDVYDKNVMAAIRFTMAFLPYMRQQKWGRVVTVTSRLGREGGGRPWFTMSKAAQTAMIKSLAMTPYLARDGITFNTVAPGSILIPDTGWEKESLEKPDQFKEMLERDFPLGRMGTPEEVADVIVFLCSKQATLVNGASVLVDGGESRVF